MAVARTPSPSDGRIPCPQCGGLVHPIAGRCKHCKADIGAQRGARPAAAAALPSLRGGTATPAANDVPQVPRPPIVAAPIAAEDSRPILPPRPTGRMDAAEPKRSILRNWPVIVIVLASLAIATAVVLMIYPAAGTAKADSHKLAPPPAPERMDTSPLPPALPPQAPQAQPPKSGQNDPWQNKQLAPIDPPPPDDNADPDDPFQGVDPFAGLGGSNGMPGLDALLRGLNTGNLGGLQDQFMFTMLGRVCARAKTCGGSQVAMLCGSVDSLLQGAKPTTCDAGQRCLARIDALSCDALAQDNPLAAIQLAQDCLQAIQGC